jgi:hypothetical protein
MERWCQETIKDAPWNNVNAFPAFSAAGEQMQDFWEGEDDGWSMQNNNGSVIEGGEATSSSIQ